MRKILAARAHVAGLSLPGFRLERSDLDVGLLPHAGEQPRQDDELRERGEADEDERLAESEDRWIAAGRNEDREDRRRYQRHRILKDRPDHQGAIGHGVRRPPAAARDVHHDDGA